MVTPAARREAVAHLRTLFEVSERRACAALGIDRYNPSRAAPLGLEREEAVPGADVQDRPPVEPLGGGDR